jgi:hypothetical protein
MATMSGASPAPGPVQVLVTAATMTTMTSMTTMTTTPSTMEGTVCKGRVRRRGRLEGEGDGPIPSTRIGRTGTTAGPKVAGAPLLRVSTVPENALSQTLLRRRLPRATSSNGNHTKPCSNGNGNSRTTLLQKLSDQASSTLHTASTTLRLRPDRPAVAVGHVDLQDPLLSAAQQFAYSQQDIVSILTDREAFQTLKASLRQRSCVTNAYLKLNVHFYVQHVKQVRLARHQHSEAKRTVQVVILAAV